MRKVGDFESLPYGGGNTQPATAVLCALMEEDHPGEAPDRSRLTIEHVMPQKLTDEWRQEFSDEAEHVHQQYRHRLANLTLSGDSTNTRLGAQAFAAKREIYRNSSVGMTWQIAEESCWNEAAMDRRTEHLAGRALAHWPWSDEMTPRDAEQADAAALRRRTENFWQFFKRQTGGLPGQKDNWRGGTQWTAPCNDFGDCIGIYVGNRDRVWLYIWVGSAGPSGAASRISRYLRTISERMADQVISGNLEQRRENGRTLQVERQWDRDDEEAWPEIVQWIQDQHDRLRDIALELHQ